MNTKSYALKVKDSEVLYKSSSGGAFTALSDYFIANNCAVISAIYNYETSQAEFVLYTDYQKRDEAKGSKYMQAKPLDSFRQAKKWLSENEGMLMFVGMGCQSDGFRRYSEMEGFRDRVFIVDIICHGVPSPSIWKEFIREFERPLSNLKFRDKRNGWQNPTGIIESNGYEISLKPYTDIFYNQCALRPSCHICPYATTQRKVDLTIGDFWGIEKALPSFNINGGVSLVLVHSLKGQNVLNAISDKVIIEECQLEDCLQPNLIHPTKKSSRRDKFWKDYKNYGIHYVIKKYNEITISAKIKYKIKRLLQIVKILK